VRGVAPQVGGQEEGTESYPVPDYVHYARLGFGVFPIKTRTKNTSFDRWQELALYGADTAEIYWRSGHFPPFAANYRNVGLSLDGLVVVDVDVNHGDGVDGFESCDRMQADHGGLPATRVHLTPRGGRQYVYRADPDRPMISRKLDASKYPGIDVKAGRGARVLCPGSITENGTYSVQDDIAISDMPPWLYHIQQGVDAGVRDTSGRTDLVEVLGGLQEDPGSSELGHNWATAPAGVLARIAAGKRRLTLDEAVGIMGLIDAARAVPEGADVVGSMVRDFYAKDMSTAAPDDSEVEVGEVSGWLKRGRRRILHLAPGDDGVIWDAWSDFDLRAVGKNVDDHGLIDSYAVDVICQSGEEFLDQILPVSVLTDGRQLRRWLARYGVRVLPEKVGVKMSDESREMRLFSYLVAQNPPAVRLISHYGLDSRSGDFLTPTGIIRADGFHRFESVRPSPSLRDLTDYGYGFVSEAEAVDTLREVLTFHFETSASVYGAWWAAALIKGQIFDRTGYFPIMQVKAPSESGKSTGFFQLMSQLSGSRDGQKIDTVAAFRDTVSAHRCGYSWLDDLENVGGLAEVLRLAVNEGTLGKKDSEARGTMNLKLVSPIVLSGEGFASIAGQKAFRDRMIVLQVLNPKGRMSLHDADRPQWDDVTALKHRHPDLSAMAGTVVQLALRWVETVDLAAQLEELRSGTGRHAEKLAILRLGARLLSTMTGDPSHVARVDSWCTEDAQEDLGAENSLTQVVIPELLVVQGYRDRPVRLDSPPYFGVPTPVVVREYEGVPAVWVNAKLLATWWFKFRNGRVLDRTETDSAFSDQMDALGCRGGKAGVRGADWDVMEVDGVFDAQGARKREQARYRRLPSVVSARLLADFGASEIEDTDAENVVPMRGRRLSPDQADAVSRR
jgi:hypothetical protein